MLAAAIFLVFLASNAVESDLLQAGYYNRVLENTDAYDRAYNEIATDPELSPEVSSLLGGTDLFGIDIAGEMLGAIAPDLVQTAVEAVIERIIAYLKAEESLDLRLEITDILGGLEGGAGLFDLFGDLGGLIGGDILGGDIPGGGDIGGIIGGLLGGDVSAEVAAIPGREYDDYDAFLAELAAVIGSVREGGPLPGEVPYVDEVNRAEADEVVDVLTTRAGIGGDTAEDIEDEVRDDEVEEAVRIALTALRLPEDETGGGPVEGGENPLEGNPLEEFLDSPYVTSQGEGPDRRYFLGPPEEVRREIEDAFAMVHFVSWMAPYGRAATGILLVACLGTLAYLARGDRRAMLFWPGIALTAAGAIGFVAWLIGREQGKSEVLARTVGDDPGIPESVERLWRDIVDQAIAEVTPSIWIPCFVALAIGVVLLVAAAQAQRGRHGTR